LCWRTVRSLQKPKIQRLHKDFLFLLLFCAARLASRPELRRRVRTRRDARKP
jgi:hypothetical protein